MHNNIDSKDILVETWGGKNAVCINGRFYGWAFYKHPDGQWVTLRKATEEEIDKARDAYYERLKDKILYGKGA